MRQFYEIFPLTTINGIELNGKKSKQQSTTTKQNDNGSMSLRILNFNYLNFTPPNVIVSRTPYHIATSTCAVFVAIC